jgi:hypothetical protein
MILPRRKFLLGLGSLIAAPAVLRLPLDFTPRGTILQPEVHHLSVDLYLSVDELFRCLIADPSTSSGELMPLWEHAQLLAQQAHGGLIPVWPPQ